MIHNFEFEKAYLTQSGKFKIKSILWFTKRFHVNVHNVMLKNIL